MHQHCTVHFAKGALPPRIATERYFLDPELGHRKGRCSVLGGPGSKEGWLRGVAKQKKTIRPQERKTTSTHHRGVCTERRGGPWEAHLTCLSSPSMGRISSPSHQAWGDCPPPGGSHVVGGRGQRASPLRLSV